MTYYEIAAKIEAKAYDTKLKYPPSIHGVYAPLAVKQYRDEVGAYRKDENRLYNEFVADLRAYFEGKLEKPLTSAQWDAVFYRAWSDGHADGYHSVLQEVDSLLGIIKRFV